MKALSSLTVFLHKLNLLMVFWGDPRMIKQISFRDRNTFPNGSSLETGHKKYKILNCTLIIGLACHDSHQTCSYDFVKWKKLKICFVNSQWLQLKDLCCFIPVVCKILKNPCLDSEKFTSQPPWHPFLSIYISLHKLKRQK